MGKPGQRSRTVGKRFVKLSQPSSHKASLGRLRRVHSLPERNNETLPLMRARIDETCRWNDRAAPCRSMLGNRNGLPHAEPRFRHPRHESANLDHGRQRTSTKNLHTTHM
jgi:hypothetical protein